MSPEKQLELKVNNRVKIFDGLSIYITNIIFEEIAPSPITDPVSGNEGENAYPAGNGVVIHFNVVNGDDSTELLLSEITEPYDSQESVDWNGYRFKLAGLEGYQDPTVKIGVEVIKAES